MATEKDKKKRRDSARDPDVNDETTKDDKERETKEPTASEPIVRDKRRIDPETGEARENSGTHDLEDQLTDEDLAKLLEGLPAENADDAPAEAAAETTTETQSDSDHLNDLKRVQAEYANYRKRVERDRFMARELAVGEVITSILPVLDDLDLAHAHGDLEGSPLELVAQKIRVIFGRYGLEQVGEIGEEFDPNYHEAVAQLPDKKVKVDTVADVAQPGYKLGERLLRPAKVAVSVPEG